MAYSLPCSCGYVLAIEATQAGATMDCPQCRASVKVPRLSALRVSAGQSAIPMNSAERVTQAVHEGKLPSNLVCPVTGTKTDAIAVFHIQCERSWQRSKDSLSEHILWTAIFGAAFGWFGTFLAPRRSNEKETLGRDTTIDAPIRVSAEILSRLSRQTNQRELRKMLSTIPEYEAVFVEFPSAHVSFGSSAQV